MEPNAQPEAEKDKGKTCRLAFRLSEEEKQMLQSRADVIGTGLSNYIRQTVLENKAILTTADDRLQLKGMAVNLNQLAHRANATGHIPSELPALLLKIKQLLADAYRQR